MQTYEVRRRRLITTGGALAAIAVYLLMAFTALSGRDFVNGAEGAYASAGDPGAIALSAIGEALRSGPDVPPAPGAAQGIPFPPFAVVVLAAAPVDGTGTARSPVEDQQVLTL